MGPGGDSEAARVDDAPDAVARHLRVEGWCVIPGVIPAHEVSAVRDSIVELHARLGRTDVSYLLNHTQCFAKYLNSNKLLGPMRAVLGDTHIRMRTNKGFVHPPADAPLPENGYVTADRKLAGAGGLHADGPFIQSAALRVAAPYQDAALQMTTIWMLSDFTEANGATRIVTGSHRLAVNPTVQNTCGGRGAGRMDPALLEAALGNLDIPHPQQVQATGTAGSVLLFDNRCWHGGGVNRSDFPRVGMIMCCEC
jgi:hypothetical protein